MSATSLPSSPATSCASVMKRSLADHIERDGLCILELHHTYSRRDITCHLAESLRSGTVGRANDNGSSIIATFAHVNIQRNATQEGYIMLCREAFAATHAKQVASHVLDHAQDRDVEFRERAKAAQRVPCRDILRLRYDRRTRERDGLCQTERRIACSRRKVNNHIIQFAPG